LLFIEFICHCFVQCELVDCVVPGADVLSLDTQAVCNTAPLASPMTPSAKVQDAYTASPLNFRPSPSPLKSMEELRQARLVLVPWSFSLFLCWSSYGFC
jgi:hypothetical protein